MNRRMFLDARDRLAVRVGNHDLRETGWDNGPSFVQTELKAPDSISPEMRAVMQQMQVNALRREAALRSHFEKRLAASAAQPSS